MIQELADSIKTVTNEDGTETKPDEKKRKQFDDFYAKYHTNVKLGVVEDTQNRNRLSKLLRYFSSQSPTQTSTFDEYISRMQEGQKDIYYIAGQSREHIERSPLLENLVSKGYEVFFCTDPIDEYALTHLDKFDGKYKIVNISREGLKIGETDEEKEKSEKQQYHALSEFLKKVLGEKIDKAIPSRRLTTSPSAIVAGSTGYTANMERIMKAQAITGPLAGQIKKTLEYNTRHPIVKELFSRIQQNPDDSVAGDIATLLYDTAALTSGYTVENPKEFSQHINRILALSLGLDPNAKIELEDSNGGAAHNANSHNKEEL